MALSAADVVNVQSTIEPIAAATRNFGALLIIGTSSVIGPAERIRQYAALDGVADDFGTAAPEYLAADLVFSQSPQPAIVYVGRRVGSAIGGYVISKAFNASEQAALLTTLQAITAGAMSVTVDGTPRALAGLDFHSITTLGGAADVIAAALTQATVVWSASTGTFTVTSKTTGTGSSVDYAINTGSGTQIAATLGLTSSLASSKSEGMAAETPLAATQLLADRSADWFGCLHADTSLTNSDHTAIAAYIEGTSPTRLYGITTQDLATLNPASTTDLAYLLSAAAYSRTFIQYSASSPYAVASAYGRAFTVDFGGNNTTITLMFKQEPGVVPEDLSETQASALKAKHCNVFVRYNNSTAIIQHGVMCNGYYFDEIHGASWLANDIQTAVYNLFYTTTTKIPQTDAGVHKITTVVEQRCVQAVANGLLAPGVWTGPTIGDVTYGTALAKGYYVYVPLIATQSVADRAARKAPPIQVAAKFAGAVHSANVILNFNR